MRFTQCVVLGVLSLVIASGHAVAEECTTDSAWKRVRAAYPIHSQMLARCDNPNTGRVVVVLTEPPAHITPAKADSIVRALFAGLAPIESVQRRRHPLGFDGWAEDLVIVIDGKVSANRAGIEDGIASLASLASGSAYKAEVEDIDALASSPRAQAPPAMEVGKEELFSWLLGPDAQKLVLIEGANSATLRERTARQEFGTYYTSSPGLVIVTVPRQSHGRLNDRLEDLRRFVVDSDVFLGAIKLSESQIALVGRERTTPLAVVPPLRLETLLLLASVRTAQLSQSYERNRAFAGKLLSDASDTFGWDWAPILLSDEIIDTEFGSLLNFTDNMLKSWSNSGKVEYAGFPYPKPGRYPFGGKSARAFVSGDKQISSLTYNWNTAGVGMLSKSGDAEIFTVRNTGSLPVSYFPEGSQEDASLKARLVQAEDEAYAYFRSLQNPLLQRAVQYAALYQVFAAFDVRANRPEERASSVASITAVEKILAKHVVQALNELVDPMLMPNKELRLWEGFSTQGLRARTLQDVQLEPETRKQIELIRNESASNVRAIDRAQSTTWRTAFAERLAKGAPLPDGVKGMLQDVSQTGIKLVHTSESVRKDVVQSTERASHGWIRTPSIVLSNRNAETLVIVGGHNIGGRATRVEFDATVPKGEVRAFGSYENGRTLTLNPADKNAEGDVVRIFDREVGLYDENKLKGVRAVEAKLREAPLALRPIRPVADALEMPATRTTRGAAPNAKAKQIGYKVDNANLTSRPEIDTLIRDTGADVIIAPAPPGYMVVRPRPAPPKTITAPNPTSMHEAVDLVVRQVSLGPPLMTQPKIAFHSMERSDALRHVQSMVKRGEAVADAGGKPPFGGDRKLFGLADGPEPQRPFTYSLTDRNPQLPKHDRTTTEKMWDSVVSITGKRRQKIYSESVKSTAELAAKPNWSEASLRFPRNEDTLFVGIPANPGHLHVVEVTVPVTINAKPQSIFVRAMSWFKDAPASTKNGDMNSAITKIFKSSEAIDVEEAFIRYKTLMIDQHGAANVQINLFREGNDIIVVELDVGGPAQSG
jgi:hypothetical protein